MNSLQPKYFIGNCRVVYILLFVCTSLCFSCEDYNTNGDPQLTYATDADFVDSTNVAFEVASGFEMKLWAPGPFLANAVSISIDNQGAAYVSETRRRKSSDIDIRQHREWMVEDLALQNVDQTREFHLKKLAPELSSQNKWMEDFNEDGSHDWRDLTVQSEYISKIWDSNGDGRADVKSLFAKDINDMITGVAAGVLHYNNDVYLTAAPDVYKFTDKDKDGDADERTTISHGYGIHIAYAGHGMSGLTIGPDGKVYWSVGDIGVNAKSKEGKQFAYPNQGAVMRCDPDGSNFEVFAHGLRNPQELEFDAFGNLISVDNDGDHDGEHERFVHILEGSDSGWRINWQFGKYNRPNEEYKVWLDENLDIPHFPGQAAYILPALALASDGPAGLTYQPGTALNEEWKNYFFVSYFKGSAARCKIEAFRLEPKGASFKLADNKDIISSGLTATGLAFGPDGALYINDWLEGYDKKSLGRIWKLDVSQRNQVERDATQKILALGVDGNSVEELQKFLQHQDMRVRLAAQFELVKRKNTDPFVNVLDQSDHQLAQIHAVWGLGQLIRDGSNSGEIVLPYLQADDPEVRAQAAKVLGDAKVNAAASQLVTLLQDPSDRVKYFSAETLGKLGHKPAFEALTDLIIATGDSDPHLRHGLIHAISQLDLEEKIIGFSKHPSSDLRIAAVVALRKMNSPGLKEFLSDSDTLVLIEASRAIHDDQSILDALPDLAGSLLNLDIQNEAFIRRAINANLRIGGTEAAERLAQYAVSTSAPLKMKQDALWALGYWENPPVLDRVEGRYRVLPSRDLSEAQTAFLAVADQLLASKNSNLYAATIEVVGRLKYEKEEDRLITLSLQTNEPLAVRRAALRSLASLESSSLERVLNIILVDKSVDLRTDAQALLGTLDLPAETVVGLLTRVLENNAMVAEKQQALTSLGNINDPAAITLLDKWLDRLIEGDLELPVQLDLIMAIENGSSSKLKSKFEAYEQKRENLPILERYQETLFGGDARRGYRLFRRDPAAQCTRCHQLDPDDGSEMVGPNLGSIGSELDRETLLAALIDPSARLSPGFGTVNITLKDGENLVGVLEQETDDSLSIRTANGSTSIISQDQIEQKKYLPSSMPPMHAVLTKVEIRDLVEFLVGRQD